MAKKLAIPESNVEWPEWDYKPFPRYVGTDEHGEALIAQKEEDIAELEDRKVYPKLLGKDGKGNPIEAHNPDDEVLKAALVKEPKAPKVADTPAPAASTAKPGKK